ncbi:hypothetical protein LCGC14_2294640 [marine sediment metagenome]|uniref:Uncharacterized protein n=1 Tax=marine sediment metagenome TaxID=412755 RepID=A0A0F9F2P2_9ZZZZ
MKVSIKYHEVMEELLRKELEWLREEFEILFKSKTEGYSEKDKKIANDILDYILENNYLYDNIRLLNLLNEVIENIENKFPDLF